MNCLSEKSSVKVIVSLEGQPNSVVESIEFGDVYKHIVVDGSVQFPTASLAPNMPATWFR